MGNVKNQIVYYYRDNNNRPRITVVAERVDEDHVNRGIAVCAMVDAPIKSVGRHIATIRMNYARDIQADAYPYDDFNDYQHIDEIFDSVMNNVDDTDTALDSEYRAQYCAEISDNERKLFD